MQKVHRLNFFMKYHYKEPDVNVRVYGIEIVLNNHPVYESGTLYLENGRSIIVTQRHFKDKACYWGSVDPGIANGIYLSPNFPKFFQENAREMDPPIFPLRKIMWELRMKPLKREAWEDYF